MSSTQRLERRLTVGRELHSLVSTMKGLAAVGINDFERASESIAAYAETVELGLQVCFREGDVPIADPRAGRAAAIVVGTDQGLCGPINREVADEAVDWLERHARAPEHRLVAVIGRRAEAALERRGVAGSHLPLPATVDGIPEVVQELVVRIDQWQAEEGVSRVAVVFQHPLSRTRRVPRVFQVAPPDAARLRRIAEEPWPTQRLPDSPHSFGVLMSGLLRADLFVALYRALADARAAEHGARLTAMQAAERSIEEQLERLTTEFHQLRQAEITAQILDVVSGYEAVSRRP